jgi:hypothetical protein
MQKGYEVDFESMSLEGAASQVSQPDVLCELGRATTAYHEAPPERVEIARKEYEEALRKFYATQED